MICILGKTASGKTAILSKLCDKGFKRILTYTTRSVRKGEKEGITYHYISDDEFKQKIDEGFFAEYRVYHTNDGDWKYGSSVESYKNAGDKSVIILTPEGYMDVVNNLKEKPIALYIYANNQTIKERLIKRGDKKEEAERRLAHDNEDFKGVENMVDRIVYNNSKDKIDDVVNTIIEYLEKKG